MINYITIKQKKHTRAKIYWTIKPLSIKYSNKEEYIIYLKKSVIGFNLNDSNLLLKVDYSSLFTEDFILLPKMIKEHLRLKFNNLSEI